MREGIAEGKVVVKKKVERAIAREETVSSTQPIIKPETKEEKEETPSISEQKPVVEAMVSEPLESETESNTTIDLSIIPLIQDELRYMGKTVESRYISAATSISDNGDNSVLITMGQAFQYNSLLPSLNHLSKALSKVTGRNVSARLELSIQKNTGRTASPKMEALKSIFGGTVEFNEVATLTAEKKETPDNEEKTNDEQSLRIFEADGDSGSPDEDD